LEYQAGACYSAGLLDSALVAGSQTPAWEPSFYGKIYSFQHIFILPNFEDYIKIY